MKAAWSQGFHLTLVALSGLCFVSLLAACHEDKRPEAAAKPEKRAEAAPMRHVWAGMSAERVSILELQCVHSSPALKLSDIKPYRDALRTVQAKVLRVVRGDPSLQGKSVQVIEWSVYQGEEQTPDLAQAPEPDATTATVGRSVACYPFDETETFVKQCKLSDDTEFSTDTPRFLNVSQPLKVTLTRAPESDFACDFSDKVEDLAAKHGAIVVLALGDSRTEAAVCPSAFQKTRAALGKDAVFNAAVVSSGIATMDFSRKHLLPGLPKCRTVLIGISPRIFSSTYSDPMEPRLTGSSAFKRLSELGAGAYFQSLIKIGSDPVKGRRMKHSGYDEFGFMENAIRALEANGGKGLKATPAADTVTALIADIKRPPFQMDEAKWKQFESLISNLTQDLQLHVLAFTNPIHPALSKVNRADDDGSMLRDHDVIVARMTALANASNGRLEFINLLREGESLCGLKAADFADLTHLNYQGALKVSVMLDERIHD
jgi:hypothetical protein